MWLQGTQSGTRGPGPKLLTTEVYSFALNQAYILAGPLFLLLISLLFLLAT